MNRGNGRVHDSRPDPSNSAVRTSARSSSATLQACAMQPRGVNGCSASKISLTEPMHASSRWCVSVSSSSLAPRSIGMTLQPGLDEMSHQPGPDRALVVGGVAGAEVAEVSRLVVRMIRRKRAQADGRQRAGLRSPAAPAPTGRGRAPGATARSQRSGWDGRHHRHRARRRRRRRESRATRSRSAR